MGGLDRGSGRRARQRAAQAAQGQLLGLLAARNQLALAVGDDDADSAPARSRLLALEFGGERGRFDGGRRCSPPPDDPERRSTSRDEARQGQGGGETRQCFYPHRQRAAASSGHRRRARLRARPAPGRGPDRPTRIRTAAKGFRTTAVSVQFAAATARTSTATAPSAIRVRRLRTRVGLERALRRHRFFIEHYGTDGARRSVTSDRPRRRSPTTLPGAASTTSGSTRPRPWRSR